MFDMAKQVTFKTIFPAVSVPLNDDYSINEKEFRRALRDLYATATQERLQDLPEQRENA